MNLLKVHSQRRGEVNRRRFNLAQVDLVELGFLEYNPGFAVFSSFIFFKPIFKLFRFLSQLVCTIGEHCNICESIDIKIDLEV